MLWEWSLCLCSDTEMKNRIRDVDVNMHTFDYVFGAYLGELIFGHSDNLSKSLQNCNLSVINGRCTTNATVETLESIRNDDSFDLFWEKVLTHAKRSDMNEPILPRQRSQPRSMQDYFGHGKGKEVVHTCHKDLYRKHYFEAFDTVINCVEDHFDLEDFKMYALLEPVLLKVAKDDEYEESKEVIEFYKEDIDELLLRSQLLTISINFQSTTEKDGLYILAKAVPWHEVVTFTGHTLG